MGGPGEVDVTGARAMGAVLGRISLTDHARFNTNGGGGGSISIRGGQFIVQNQSSVFANNTGALNATGGIDIQAGTVAISSGSRVTTDVRGTVNGGTLSVTADRLELHDRGAIRSFTFGTGDAGAITVEAGQLLIVGIPGADRLPRGS